MPRLSVPAARTRRGAARIIVVGDLVVDVVLAPQRPLESATDVSGRVSVRQGGSASTTARWLARLGARTTLIAAVGRDAAGRALVEAVRSDGVVAHVVRIAGAPTGRVGIVVDPTGERSFVADRGAADRLELIDVRTDWFERCEHLHLPIYSLVGPVAGAGRRALRLARAAGGTVSLDLASVGPLLARGRRAANSVVQAARPDVLFATAAEADALLGGTPIEGLLAFAPVAIVKRGAEGATVLAAEDGDRLRFEVATTRIRAQDTTGAGDAFDAGFIVQWLASRQAGRSLPASLQRAALAGHRAATRQLRDERPELRLL